MSDRDEWIRENVEASHKASEASRYQQSGLSYKSTKLSSKNFEALMKQRGITGEPQKKLRESMSNMQTRHAKAGEIFVTTHGTEKSSGIFVSKDSLGKTPDERVNKGALPHSNSAEYETMVALGKDQNIISGEIKAQSKFSKMDPDQRPREGGGTQVVTDGGYNSGAVINRDAKYPVPVNSAEKTSGSKEKSNTGSTHSSASHKKGHTR